MRKDLGLGAPSWAWSMLWCVVWGVRSGKCSLVQQIKNRFHQSSTVRFLSLSVRWMACCNQPLPVAEGSGSAWTHSPGSALIHPM